MHDPNKVSISLPTDLRQVLDREAERAGESRSYVVRQALRRYIFEEARDSAQKARAAAEAS